LRVSSRGGNRRKIQRKKKKESTIRKIFEVLPRGRFNATTGKKKRMERLRKETGLGVFQLGVRGEQQDAKGGLKEEIRREAHSQEKRRRYWTKNRRTGPRREKKRVLKMVILELVAAGGSKSSPSVRTKIRHEGIK